MTIVEQLIFGRQLPEDRKIYKYTVLRAYFYFIIFAAAVFYIILDTANGVDTYIDLYLLMVVVAAIGIIINRFRLYAFANALLIIFSNAIVFVFADSDSLLGGLFFYFLATSLTALVLFSYKYRFFGLLCVFISLTLGILAFVYDFNLVQQPPYDEATISVSFLANFIMGVLSCSFIVYFLIQENHQSEQRLMEKQGQLLAATNEINRSKKRFETAVKGAKAGIYEWSLKDNSVFVSDYWKELLGYEAHELESMSIEKYVTFVHPEDTEVSYQKIQEVLRTRESYQSETRLRTKQGVYKWFQDSGLIRTDPEDNTSYVVGSLIDIDARKKAEKEIEEKTYQLTKTNEELDRFVYSASHDMRAPLTSLLGLINLAQMSGDLSELKTYHSMMKDRIKVMEGFIKEVTDYSRNARLELAIKQHSLAALVKEVAEHLAYFDIKGRMKLAVNIDHNLIVHTDSSRLKIVLNNLISNAYKYHRLDIENPYITVSAAISGNHVEIEIEDNGIGINEVHHERIFEMFYRASENSEGSGLGLYIVKETLQKLGGTISVKSGLGVGSTFKLRLPMS